MCLIKVSKILFEEKIYKRYPTSFSKLMGVSKVNYLPKNTRNSSNKCTVCLLGEFTLKIEIFKSQAIT